LSILKFYNFFEVYAEKDTERNISEERYFLIFIAIYLQKTKNYLLTIRKIQERI
jgi:hypothetical protein